MPTADNYVRQGVTTILEGPDGTSAVPLKPFLDRLDANRDSEINVAEAVHSAEVLIGAYRSAATREVQCVEDVHACPGHIACDAASRSELVIPLLAGGELVGVLDLDSPVPGRFDQEDAAGCAELAQRLKGRFGGISTRGREG